MSDTCEFCNYVPDHRYLCDPAGPDICETCQKLLDLEDRIKETSTLLADLKKERQKLKEEANINHERLVHQRLPMEVMADIFKLCLPASEDVMKLDLEDKTRSVPRYALYDLFILSAVCRRWRTITHSIPALWTTLLLYARASHSRTASESALDYQPSYSFPEPLFIKNWIDRAGDLPISVNLYISYNRTIRDAAIQTINVLNQYADRWLEMKYEGPPNLLQHLSSEEQTLPELRMLHLKPLDPIDDPSDTLKLHPTRLSQLLITNVELVSVNFEWHHLTKLEMGSASLSECCEALRRAPSLTHCIFRGGGSVELAFPLPENLIVLNKLQHLELVQGRARHYLYPNILEHFLCPSLKTLALHFNREPVNLPLIVNSLLRFGCSLDRLSLMHAKLSESDMTSLCQGLPMLSHLHITLYDSESTARSLFTHLAEFSTVDGRTEPRYLPALRSLAVDEDDQPSWVHWRILPNIFGPPSTDSPPATGSPENRRQALESVELTIINSPEIFTTQIYDSIGEETMKRVLGLREAGVKWKLAYGKTRSPLIGPSARGFPHYWQIWQT